MRGWIFELSETFYVTFNFKEGSNKDVFESPP
jgi:hypothetical protein